VRVAAADSLKASCFHEAFPIHLGEPCHAEQRHVSMHLVPQQPDRVAYAGLAANRGRLQQRAPYENEVCSQCEGF